MSINVLNAHGQKIHVFSTNILQRRGKQQLHGPDTQQGNNSGCCWTGVCGPVKSVNISRSIFNSWFILAVVISVACASYFTVVRLRKDSVSLNYTVSALLAWCFLYIVFVLFYKVRGETVVLIPSFGIQLEKCYAFGRTSTRFIPYDVVKDVVINEAISMYKVIYYLVVLMKCPDSETETAVIPVFTHSWPRLDILSEIYNVCQESLISYQQEDT